MGDDLEQALKGKTLADIIHALPCDHPIQVEIDRLKGELEEAKRQNSEYIDLIDSMQKGREIAVSSLSQELSGARAENEKLKLLSVSNKTYQCNYCGKSQCVVAPLNKEEIRQEAAREIICKHIEFFLIDSHDRSCLIRSICKSFKLEG